MISHKHKCIFVHIPKTGGASIERLIWGGIPDRKEEDLWMGFKDEYRNKYQTGGLQHLLARQIREEVGDDTFDSYFRFAMVRNPWDKAVSQYVYMHKREDLRRFIGMKPGDDLRRYLELINHRVHVQWQQQHAFIYDDEGGLLVDEFGRFEDYDRTVVGWMNRMGVDVPRDEDGSPILPRINPGERRHYREYYDEETEGMVREMYAKDISLFGYEF